MIFWISNEPSKPENDRKVSSIDITNSKNWIGRIGHWMSEQSGVWIQTNGLAFSYVSNTDVGWEGDQINLDTQGMETFMQRFGSGTQDNIIIDDNDTPLSWHQYEFCQWEGTNFAGNLRWYCMDDSQTETRVVTQLSIDDPGQGYISENGILLESPSCDPVTNSFCGRGLMIDIQASAVKYGLVNQAQSFFQRQPLSQRTEPRDH